MTGETYRTIYGKTKIETETVVELVETYSHDDKYSLSLRIMNNIIDEYFVLLNADGEVNTDSYTQDKRDFALASMTVEEVRNMVYKYIASQLTRPFGGYQFTTPRVKRVNEQVKKFMDYYEHTILPKKSILSGKEL